MTPSPAIQTTSPEGPAPALFEELLKGVSRSIYLSLKALPSSLRRPMGLGYLFCRAADTLADTRLLPRLRRLEHLDLFRAQFDLPAPDAKALSRLQSTGAESREHPNERRLLAHLPDCFRWLDALDPRDRHEVREVVGGVVQGMQMDLSIFGGEDEAGLAALSSLQELDRYCHFIGGCPGIFWTRLCFRHRPRLQNLSEAEMIRRGTEFGKGLQLTNILRDLAADLRNGRCYVPSRELERRGLSPFDLLHPNAWPRLREVYFSLIARARAGLDEGLSYIRALPASELRLRLACVWPLLLAQRTLSLLAASSQVLDPSKAVKVARPELYRIMALSTALAASDAGLSALYRRLAR